ncbi:hypothetical protein EEL31_08630 [Brevibacillus laterosporus]|uniref:Uncharacterized protein n=1 Tax=Brevibacillus laterosporus TaxID=1465 RepID=A0A518VC95_BRELA|nr:hypothetical protein [Brevibacillus laterosporus]QDX94613.1 hypothetical protein EEL30_21450 [Brevibacillus laterosporus]TPG68576.1 hypothetical protein EEL31_08630 [Brevibacillus laterosporus]
MERYVAQLRYVNAIQMTRDFSFQNDNRLFKGEIGDYIVTENGYQYALPRNVFENLFKKSTIPESLHQVDFEQAYKETYDLFEKVY